MDPLDLVLGAATDLLDRVDGTLAGQGAPAGHPVWSMMRQLRSLPGDAVRAVAALRPEPLAAAVAALGPLAQAYGQAAETTTAPAGWAGGTAEAYTAWAGSFTEHLAGRSSAGRSSAGRDGLAARAEATARFADELARWMVLSRRELARTLAVVLGSAQAVTVRTASADASARAAADIAARVLGAVAESYAHALALHDEWSGTLGEQVYRPPGPTGPTPAGFRVIG